MEINMLAEISSKFISELPTNVSEALEDVELLICTSPGAATKQLKIELKELFTETIPEDCKGIFVGSPAEVSKEEDTESEDEEVMYYPEGYVVICASNIEDAKEAAIVLTHEVAHALGWDEEEVKQFGLGVDVEKPKETTNVPENSSS